MAVNKKYNLNEDDLGFLDYVEKEESKGPENQDIPWYKSYPSAIGRGLVKGLSQVGQMMGPLGTTYEQNIASQQREKQLNQYLPIGQDFGPKALERGISSGLQAGAFPGGAALMGRGLAGGALAEGVKELGGPEWLQAFTEIGAQLAPGLGRQVVNRLPGQTAQTERNLTENARRLGLTENELALTLNQRGPLKDFMTEIAAKGGRTVNRFQNTRAALGRVWNNLRNTPEAQRTLNGQQSSQLINNMSNRLSRLSSNQRDIILQDYNDLLGSQMRGEDLIDFWQKLNYNIARGEEGLGIIKQDLQRAIYQISPELGRDFQITNQLYGNFHRLAERMGPNVAESLIRAGEQGIVISAITTGNYPLLKKVLGPLLARQLATELTTNPRFMNLSSKFINAFERGSLVNAKKSYDQLLIEIGKENAEAATKMSGLDLDKIFESLKEYESEENQSPRPKGERK